MNDARFTTHEKKKKKKPSPYLLQDRVERVW